MPEALSDAAERLLSRNPVVLHATSWPICWPGRGCRPATFRQRFREERLEPHGQQPDLHDPDLLVPLLTVALALFTAFPMFSKFQGALGTSQSLDPRQHRQARVGLAGLQACDQG